MGLLLMLDLRSGAVMLKYSDIQVGEMILQSHGTTTTAGPPLRGHAMLKYLEILYREFFKSIKIYTVKNKSTPSTRFLFCPSASCAWVHTRVAMK